MDQEENNKSDPVTDPKAGAAPAGESKPEKEKERSGTAYPYYGLSRGIEIISAVRRAGGNEAPNADVMRELKVTKVADRLWAYGIPTAIQFGLIERIGRGDDGRIKLTDLAARIALPATPDEERLAKVAAFKTPELYATLLEKFAGHPVPSKDGLKNILHRDFKIVESMAPIAAEAFFDSLKVAELITTNNTIWLGDGATPTVKPLAGEHGAKEEPPKPKPGMQTITVPENFIIYRCKLSGGRVIEVPLPPDFKNADVERLYAFLKTQVDDEPTATAPLPVLPPLGK